MKHEGDRLLGRARLVALSLALLLAWSLPATYVLATRHIAHPLTTLAATADASPIKDLSPGSHSGKSRRSGDACQLPHHDAEQPAGAQHRSHAEDQGVGSLTYSIAHD